MMPIRYDETLINNSINQKNVNLNDFSHAYRFLFISGGM